MWLEVSRVSHIRESMMSSANDCRPIAHDQAHKAGILHRDISAGNVLIQIKEVVRDGKVVRTRDALLTDWELSKRLDQS